MDEKRTLPEGEREVGLYCAMLHLAYFTEDAKNDRIANMAKACEVCRIRENIGCRFDYYNKVMPLCESVGVSISPCIMHAEYPVHLER